MGPVCLNQTTSACLPESRQPLRSRVARKSLSPEHFSSSARTILRDARHPRCAPLRRVSIKTPSPPCGADHPAAQQQRINLADLAFFGENCYAHQSIVRVAVLHSKGIHAMGVLFHRLDLLFAVSPRGCVELVRFLRELRDAGQRHGRHAADFEFLLQRTIGTLPVNWRSAPVSCGRAQQHSIRRASRPHRRGSGARKRGSPSARGRNPSDFPEARSP